jgi:lipoate-protein ligase B
VVRRADRGVVSGSSVASLAPLQSCWLGRIGYAEAAALQESVRRRILDGDEGAERLLLCEHDPVITLGRGALSENVLAAPDLLRARGISLERSSRGGDVTYHGPGQLVAYPIVRLTHGVVAHVEAMAEAAVEVAAAFGVSARFRRDRPGVWVDERKKLAAVGVHVHRRVAIHGMALNVATALDAFELIVPCGLSGTFATSLSAEAGRPISVADTVLPLSAALARALGRTAAPISARI